MLTGHPVGERTFLLHFPNCVVSVDFAAGQAVLYGSENVLTIGEHDGIDWRTILLREREYRRANQENANQATSGILRAVDAIVNGWEYLGAPDDAVNYGWLDDGRSG